MLGQVPLWNDAVAIYSSYQTELLAWQNQHQANVNDLLALAFVQHHQKTLPQGWWRDATLQRIRALVLRARKVRVNAKNTPHYTAAKTLELGLEGLDVIRLQQLINQGGALDQADHARDYAEHIGCNAHELKTFIHRLSDER